MRRAAVLAVASGPGIGKETLTQRLAPAEIGRFGPQLGEIAATRCSTPVARTPLETSPGSVALNWIVPLLLCQPWLLASGSVAVVTGGVVSTGRDRAHHRAV